MVLKKNSLDYKLFNIIKMYQSKYIYFLIQIKKLDHKFLDLVLNVLDYLFIFKYLKKTIGYNYYNSCLNKLFSKFR